MLEDFHLFHWSRRLEQLLAGERVRRVGGRQRGRPELDFGPAGTLTLDLDPHFPGCSLAPPGRVPDRQACPEFTPPDRRLEGARLERVRKRTDDRELIFHFRRAEEDSILYVALRPIAPSACLCDGDGHVLWTAGPQASRLPRPGGPYLPASRPERLPPERQAVLSLLRESDPAGWEKLLLRQVATLGPTLLEEARHRSGSPPDRSPAGPAGSLSDLERLSAAVEEVCAEAYRPAAVFYLYSRCGPDGDERVRHPLRDFRLSPFPLRGLSGWAARQGDTMEPLVLELARHAREFRVFSELRNRSLAALRERQRQVSGKVHSLSAELAAAAQAARCKEFGELILANLHRFGADSRAPWVEVEDFYAPAGETLRIPLNPEKTLRENADLLFRRHRKARQAAELLPGRLRREEERLARLEADLAALETAATPAEVRRLHARHEDAPAAGPARKPKPLPAIAGKPFRRFQTSGGLTVLVGRSAAENDRLTFKVGRPDDCWLHAADYAGSHAVLLWGRKDEPPQRDLLEAAGVAAWYSGARKSPRAEVRWTRCKFVQKIKGTPGLVRLMKFHTLRVPPRLPETPPDAD